MAQVGLDLPFWGRILMLIVNLLPIPAWIKVVIPIIIALIEKLPREQRAAARDELVNAARKARQTGDAGDLIPLIHKHCSGGMCPPNLVGDSAREND